jgi:cyclopropane fatty-acyl-phospholipid synthase-like methyltransferase/methyltransferase-like protein
MAVLHGLSPTPVHKCRVLEVACGDGSNLIPMAYAMPGSEFVGFDLAGLPIERGQARIRELGLKNLRLFQGDLLDQGAELGQFDYILAHGFYAWVPEPVQDRLLALCREWLTPNGVLFVSYNALPGSYLRSMVRDMLLFRAEGVENEEDGVRAGLEFVRFLAETRKEGDIYREILNFQLKRLSARAAAVTRHDEMSEGFRPVYFLDFAKHAKRHGFEYLCEAELPPPPDPCYQREIVSALEREQGGDALRYEQALDFSRMRSYRETLLVKEGSAPQRDFAAENLRRLLFCSMAKLEPGKTPGATAFVLPGGIRMESNHPAVKVLLEELERAWPRALSFEELEPKLAATGFALDDEGRALLVRLIVAKMVNLRTWVAPVTDCIPERPRASAVSRQQGRTSARATSLLHMVVELNDERSRRLLQLADGTRTCSELLEAIRLEFAKTPREEIEAELDEALEMFWKSGILEA